MDARRSIAFAVTLGLVLSISGIIVSSGVRPQYAAAVRPVETPAAEVGPGGLLLSASHVGAEFRFASFRTLDQVLMKRVGGSPTDLIPGPGDSAMARPLPAPRGTPVSATVGATLVLLNGTLVPNNLLARNGADPGQVAWDSDNGLLYVVDTPTANVTVVDPTTRAVVDQIAVGLGPVAISLDSANGDLYVVNSFSGTISVIDGATNVVVTTFRVGANPEAIVYDPDTEDLYAVVDGSGPNGNLSVINGTTNSVTATIPIGVYPMGLAYDSDNGNLYVAEAGGPLEQGCYCHFFAGVVHASTGASLGKIPVGYQPVAVAFDPDNGYVYVLNVVTNNLTVIDGATEHPIGSIVAGPNGSVSWNLVYDPVNGYLYIENDADLYYGGVTMVNPTNMSAAGSFQTGFQPYGAAVEPSTGAVAVVNTGSDNLTISWAASFGTDEEVTLGTAPSAAVFDPRNGDIYVADSSSNNVSVVNRTGEQIGTAYAGYAPTAIAYDSRNGNLFIVDSSGDSLTVISSSLDLGDAFVATISVPDPSGIAFDPTNGYLYVPQWGSGSLYPIVAGNVTVVNGSSDQVVGQLHAGVYPDQVQYDPTNGLLYVANLGQEFSPPYGWNVTVISPESATTVGAIQVGCGPDALALDSVDDLLYVANSCSNNLTVINGTTNHVLGAIAVGDCPYAEAYDNTTGDLLVANYCSNNVSVVDDPSGVGTVVGTIRVGLQPDAAARNALTGGLYVANEHSGTVSELRLAPAPAFPVTFSVRGLPTGVRWWVNISGGPTLSTTASAQTVWLVNGSYAYRIGSADKRWASEAGTVTVSGVGVVVSVGFEARAYSLTLTVTGTLAKGAAKTFAKKGWTVVLNGSVDHGTGSSLVFTGVRNGTYPVLVFGPSGFEMTGSGLVTVHGTTSVPVTVTKGKTVTLSFHEKGLAGSTLWCVTVDGYQQCTKGMTLKFLDLAPSVAYAYTVGTVTGYSISAKIGKTVEPLSGSLTLTKSTTVKLTYTA